MNERGKRTSRTKRVLLSLVAAGALAIGGIAALTANNADADIPINRYDSGVDVTTPPAIGVTTPPAIDVTSPSAAGFAQFDDGNPGLPPLQARSQQAESSAQASSDAPGDDGDIFDGVHLFLHIDSPLISCVVTGRAVQVTDVRPQIVNERTLVPVRFLAYALGATVNWNEATRQVTLALDGQSITFAIGETTPGMDVPAQIIDDRTMVPLRFISEFFDATINWHEDIRRIEIIRQNG